MRKAAIVSVCLGGVLVVGLLARSRRGDAPARTPRAAAASERAIPESRAASDPDPLCAEISGLRREIRELKESLARLGGTPSLESALPSASPERTRLLSEVRAIRAFEEMSSQLGPFGGFSLDMPTFGGDLPTESAEEYRRLRLELAQELLGLTDLDGFSRAVDAAAGELKQLYGEEIQDESEYAGRLQKILSRFDGFLDLRKLRHRYFRTQLESWLSGFMQE